MQNNLFTLVTLTLLATQNGRSALATERSSLVFIQGSVPGLTHPIPEFEARKDKITYFEIDRAAKVISGGELQDLDGNYAYMNSDERYGGVLKDPGDQSYWMLWQSKLSGRIALWKIERDVNTQKPVITKTGMMRNLDRSPTYIDPNKYRILITADTNQDGNAEIIFAETLTPPVDVAFKLGKLLRLSFDFVEHGLIAKNFRPFPSLIPEDLRSIGMPILVDSLGPDQEPEIIYTELDQSDWRCKEVDCYFLRAHKIKDGVIQRESRYLFNPVDGKKLRFGTLNMTFEGIVTKVVSLTDIDSDGKKELLVHDIIYPIRQWRVGPFRVAAGPMKIVPIDATGTSSISGHLRDLRSVTYASPEMKQKFEPHIMDIFLGTLGGGSFAQHIDFWHGYKKEKISSSYEMGRSWHFFNTQSRPEITSLPRVYHWKTTPDAAGHSEVLLGIPQWSTVRGGMCLTAAAMTQTFREFLTRFRTARLIDPHPDFPRHTIELIAASFNEDKNATPDEIRICNAPTAKFLKMRFKISGPPATPPTDPACIPTPRRPCPPPVTPPPVEQNRVAVEKWLQAFIDSSRGKDWYLAPGTQTFDLRRVYKLNPDTALPAQLTVTPFLKPGS